jgi:hypothetical protein
MKETSLKYALDIDLNCEATALQERVNQHNNIGAKHCSQRPPKLTIERLNNIGFANSIFE